MAQATDEATLKREWLKERGEALAKEATSEPDYHRRRELEQAALAFHRAAHKVALMQAALSLA